MAEFKINEIEEVSRFVELQEPVWWNADGTKLVADGSPEASSLYGTTGDRLPLEQAIQDGLVKDPAAKKTAKKKAK